MNRCLTSECNAAVTNSDFKGLCLKCYSAAKKKVASGETTWEELEALGLVMSKDETPFEAAFRRKKEERNHDQTMIR